MSQAHRIDIVAMGEPMVEFNQTQGEGGRLYLQEFGGDTSNFAVAAARQGARVVYVSAVGDDAWGRLLREGTEDFNYPWIVSSAFVAMTSVLVLVTFVGEAIREAFDPKKFTTYQ